MEILYSPQFAREYQKLPAKVKEKAENKERIFRRDAFNPRLKTHKLKGKLSDFWAFSIDLRYRIVFKFQKSNKVRFYAIGDHSAYKNL